MAEYNYQNVSPARHTLTGTVGQFLCVDQAGLVTDDEPDITFGISLISGGSGDVIPVQQFGVAKITASAAISAGAEVMATASGAGKISTLSGATSRGIGVALTASLADGDVIEVQLKPLPNVLNTTA